jgi:hypothetical protein
LARNELGNSENSRIKKRFFNMLSNAEDTRTMNYIFLNKNFFNLTFELGVFFAAHILAGPARYNTSELPKMCEHSKKKKSSDLGILVYSKSQLTATTNSFILMCNSIMNDFLLGNCK